ncbi:MAG: methyltransferase domain-containing protein [Nitritalea sp.]
MTDNEILAAWKRHASDWMHLLAEEGISSRQVTNPAMVQFATERAVGQVLVDMGCGEGWLSLALRAKGFTCFGVDGTEALVQAGNKKGGGQLFFHKSYAQLQQELHQEGLSTWEQLFGKGMMPRTFIFNFSLYHRGTGELLQALGAYTPADTQLLIQTLHPYAILQQGHPYDVHCLPDAWKGLPGNFQQSHAFEMLTFEAWAALFEASGWQIATIQEPKRSGIPLSVLFALKKQ